MTQFDAVTATRIPRTIRNRLAVCVALLVLGIAVVATSAIVVLSVKVAAVSEESERTDRLQAAHEALSAGLIEQRTAVLRNALAPSAAVTAAFAEAVDAEVDVYVAIGRLAPGDAAMQASAETVRDHANAWRSSCAEPFMREGGTSGFDVESMLSTSDRAFEPVLAAIGTLDGLIEARHHASAVELSAIVSNRQVFVVPLLVGIAAATAIAGAWVTRSISGPLHRLNRTAQALVAGDQVTFVAEDDDEIGALATVLERMRLDAVSRYDAARNTDPLTGLHNARFFDAYLEQEFVLAERDGDSIGIIMLDVDHFKEFNDTYGHPAGDEALRALSRTMRGTLRASDVVARYGGEEFIIALHHATLAEARSVAEKVRAAAEQMVIEIGAARYARITVSMGVAATDVHELDRAGLIALADAALYRAKDAGRNQVHLAPHALRERHLRLAEADAG